MKINRPNQVWASDITYIKTINGFCYLALIKSGGEWISSVALESALIAHPKIKEATAIAIPDRKWIEKPLASIVLMNSKDKILDEELIEFLSKDFVNYQIPKNYVYIKEVPKTSVGKFDKKEIRILFTEGKLI